MWYRQKLYAKIKLWQTVFMFSANCFHFFSQTQDTQGDYTLRSESTLGAQVILLVLSCDGSYYKAMANNISILSVKTCFLEAKKISNDQEPTQSDPTSSSQNQKGNN